MLYVQSDVDCSFVLHSRRFCCEIGLSCVAGIFHLFHLLLLLLQHMQPSSLELDKKCCYHRYNSIYVWKFFTENCLHGSMLNAFELLLTQMHLLETILPQIHSISIQHYQYKSHTQFFFSFKKKIQKTINLPFKMCALEPLFW